MELVTLIQTPGWTSPAPPRPLLTFILLHTDSGVGEDTGVSLQVVVVGAVIILILEGAVLTTLLCGERGHSCEVTRTDLGSSSRHTHTRSRAHRRHRTICTQLCLSCYLSSAPPPSGSGAGTSCSCLSGCLSPRSGSAHSPGCSHTQPGSPGRGGVGWSGTPPGGRTDTAPKGRAGEAAPHPRVRAERGH